MHVDLNMNHSIIDVVETTRRVSVWDLGLCTDAISLGMRFDTLWSLDAVTALYLASCSWCREHRYYRRFKGSGMSRFEETFPFHSVKRSMFDSGRSRVDVARRNKLLLLMTSVPPRAGSSGRSSGRLSTNKDARQTNVILRTASLTNAMACYESEKPTNAKVTKEVLRWPRRTLQRFPGMLRRRGGSPSM